MRPLPGLARAPWPDRLFAYLPYVSLIGLAVLVADIMLSFEEPHSLLLIGGAVLLCAAPVGMLIHFTATSQLSPDEKRLWLAALATRRAPALFAAYFLPDERAQATQRLATTPEVRG
jgi:hypothetical protein